MRQRKVKNEEEKLAALVHRTIENPTAMKGNWPKPCYLEMGCGKGQFIASLAKMDPEGFYIGCEGIGSVVLRAMEMIEAMDLPNVKFIADYINAPEEYFAPGELSAIYLNFSDPWPKARHAKRRLTSPQFLNRYREFLAADGDLEFKTDNQDLFAFSLESVPEAGWKLMAHTFDLHHDETMNQGNIMTEYEAKFSGLGQPICKLIAVPMPSIAEP